MEKLELIQIIGNEICEGCGPHADCGEDPKECFRIINAIGYLDNYLEESAVQLSVEADGLNLDANRLT